MGFQTTLGCCHLSSSKVCDRFTDGVFSDISRLPKVTHSSLQLPYDETTGFSLQDGQTLIDQLLRYNRGGQRDSAEHHASRASSYNIETRVKSRAGRERRVSLPELVTVCRILLVRDLEADDGWEGADTAGVRLGPPAGRLTLGLVGPLPLSVPVVLKCTQYYTAA